MRTTTFGGRFSNIERAAAGRSYIMKGVFDRRPFLCSAHGAPDQFPMKLKGMNSPHTSRLSSVISTVTVSGACSPAIRPD